MKKRCVHILKNGKQCARFLDDVERHEKCWQHRNMKTWRAVRWTVIGSVIVSLLTIITKLDETVELIQDRFGKKQIEIVIDESNKLKNIQTEQKITLKAHLRNTGKSDIDNIKLNLIATNPDIVVVTVNKLSQLVSLKQGDVYDFELGLTGKKEGFTEFQIEFVDGSLKKYISPQLPVKVTNELIDTGALSAKFSYHYDVPYRYLYYLEDDELRKMRLLLPNNHPAAKTLIDPITLYLFNRTANYINIDQINLVLNSYKPLPDRVVVGQLAKGVNDKELFVVNLSPEVSESSVLGNKFIELSSQDGHSILIDFRTYISGIYEFNFDLLYYENENSRLTSSEEFGLAYFDASSDIEWSSLGSFDDNIAEKMLKASSSAWDIMRHNDTLSTKEIIDILDQEEEEISDDELSDDELLGLLNMGNKYLDEKRYNDAIVYLQKYLDNSPGKLSDFYLLADVYKLAGKSRESISILEAAKERYPNNPNLLLSISRVYEDLGEYEKSLEYTKELIEWTPNRTQFWIEASFLSSKLDQPEIAINYAEKAIKINPLDPRPYLAKSIAYAKNDMASMAWDNILFFSVAEVLHSLDEISELVDNGGKVDIIVKALSIVHSMEYSRSDNKFFGKLLEFYPNIIRVQEIVNQTLGDTELSSVLKALNDKIDILLNKSESISVTSDKSRIKVRAVDTVTIDNQIKCLLGRKRSFDVMSTELIVTLRNIAGTKLSNLELIPKYSIFDLSMPSSDSLEPEYEIEIGRASVMEIFSNTTVKDEGKTPFVINNTFDIRGVNQFIGEMAFGTAILDSLSFEVKFTNTHLNRDVSIIFENCIAETIAIK